MFDITVCRRNRTTSQKTLGVMLRVWPLCSENTPISNMTSSLWEHRSGITFLFLIGCGLYNEHIILSLVCWCEPSVALSWWYQRQQEKSSHALLWKWKLLKLSFCFIYCNSLRHYVYLLSEFYLKKWERSFLLLCTPVHHKILLPGTDPGFVDCALGPADCAC